MNNSALVILEVLLLFLSFSTFILYFISRNKSKVTSVATVLVLLGIVNENIFIPWVYGKVIQQFPLLGTVSNITVFLLLYIILHEQICLNKNDISEKCFDFIGLWLLPCFAFLFFNSTIVLSNLKFDNHFLGAASITILLGYLTRKKPNNDLLFQISGLFIAILWVGLVIVDPYLYSYNVEAKYFVNEVINSFSVNAGWACFPIMFFLGNLSQKKIIDDVDSTKIFKTIYFIFVGSMIFRDPEMSKLASKIPIFKDVALASLDVSNYALLPIYGTLKIIKKRKN